MTHGALSRTPQARGDVPVTACTTEHTTPVAQQSRPKWESVASKNIGTSTHVPIRSLELFEKDRNSSFGSGNADATPALAAFAVSGHNALFDLLILGLFLRTLCLCRTAWPRGSASLR